MRYPLAPCAKPRMTQRDKWAKREPVLRYRAFCDRARLMRISVPPACRVVFHIAMPASWSEKKRRECAGQPHMTRPDIDNLAKGLFDALFEDDSHIWRCDATKLWAREGAIDVEPLEEPP
jgi:Holliday junction resolvase RusA-like endonuclease